MSKSVNVGVGERQVSEYHGWLVSGVVNVKGGGCLGW